MKNFTETANYIIRKSEKSGSGFDLLRKVGDRTMFLKNSHFQTPLIVLANKLEAGQV